MTKLSITAKGQVTLRKEVLQHLGLRPGDKVAVDLVLRRVFRVCYPKAHQTHGHLHHFICVRVVHERARSFGLELVHEGLAGRYAALV